MNKSELAGALLLLVSLLSSSCDSKPKPAPTEPAPAEQTPIEPAPAEPASTGQERTELAPAEPAPADQASSEVAPSEQSLGEQPQTAQAATEQVSAEEPQAEQQPAEPAPSEESPAAQAPLDESVKDAKLEYMKVLQASMDAAVEQKDMEKAKQFAREIQKVAAEINAPGNLSKANEESLEPAESADQNTVVAESNEEESPAPAETPEPAATPEAAKTSDSNSTYEAEIARLVEQWNKEKAQAVAPIQKRFDMAAQQLLRKVTQSGNLEAAMKLKEVIEDPEELADFKNEAKTMQDKELVRLVDQRDKAASVAAAPAERRFDLATQQLIRKATQTGNLDAAIKLKEMIAEAKNAADSAPVEVAKVGSKSPSGSSKGKECPEKDFEVSISGDGCAITKYVGNSKRVIVPASIEEKPVVGIEFRAFRDNSKIEEVILPDTIKFINNGVFWNCSKLSKINIPPSVSLINQNAFSLTALKEIHIPASVTFFGFQLGCNSLVEINVDPASEHFRSIDGVLYDKQVTTLIHVPGGLKIKKLKVPNSVKSVAKNCMAGSQLKTIQIPREAELHEEAFVGAENVEVIRY
jgi:hypothetical protein